MELIEELVIRGGGFGLFVLGRAAWSAASGTVPEPLTMGAIGALIATVVPGDVLRVLMPFLLVAIALYFALKPNISDEDRHQRMTPFVFGVTLVPLIGLYDGVFGPGTGSFFMLGFVMLAGYGVLKATAHTKLLNFASNIGSLAVFVFSGATWSLNMKVQSLNMPC